MTPIAELMVSARPPGQLVALDGNRRRYSWHQFHGAVAALVRQLAAQPCGRWLLYTDNSYRFAVGLMALLHSGNTVLLPGNGQPGTLAEWAGRCDGMLGDGMLGVAGGLSIPLAGDPSTEDETAELRPLDANTCLIEVVTSGSTGKAQVIAKPLRCFEQELQTHAELWQRELAESTIFATVSHQHIYGLLFRLLLPLCCGRPFWSVSHSYPEPLLADIRQHGESALLVSSPAHLGRLPLTLTASDHGGLLRLILSSGGPLSLEAATAVQRQLGLLPVEIFGSTETGGVAWRQQAGPDQPWRPLPGVALTADPDSGQLVVCSGYCVADHSVVDHGTADDVADYSGGYPPNSFTMGDLVTFLDDGRFLLRGRADRIVKIEQKRLSLTAMEQHLQSSPWVNAAKLLVLSGAGESAGTREPLAAVVELSPAGRDMLNREGKLAVNQGLKQHLLQHYERVLLPRKWRYPASMPVNSQGKLPLAELEALFAMPPQPSIEAPITFQLLRESDSQRVFRAQLHADQPEFQGHFPELALLPGVVQVDRAMCLQPWYEQRHFRRIDQLKFKDMITPGRALELILEYRGGGKVRFEYRCDEKSMSSGTLIFEGPAIAGEVE